MTSLQHKTAAELASGDNCEIIAVVDASGSMNPYIASSIDGFNGFLRTQRRQPGQARLSLATFNDHTNILYEGRALDHAQSLDYNSYRCGGSTALNDAVGLMLMRQGERIAREKWAAKVIVAILTDGEENCSREISGQRLQELVRDREDAGWTFVYLRANGDAFLGATQLGIRNTRFARGFEATAVGTQDAYRSISEATSTIRSAGKISAPPQVIALPGPSND